MALIGYARRQSQYSLSTQVAALTQAGCDLILQEQSSQGSTQRLQALKVDRKGEDILLTFIHEVNLIQPQLQAVLKSQKIATSRKRGRPTKKTPDLAQNALELWLGGCTNKDICRTLEISPSTLNRLKREIEASYLLFLTSWILFQTTQPARLKLVFLLSFS